MREDDVEDRWVEAAGLRFHSLAIPGDQAAPPLLLIPGVGLSAKNLVPLLRALARAGRAEAHALDLPGFGRTRVPGQPLDLIGLGAALRVWVEAMAWRQPALLGVSFGCQVVMEAAVRTPFFAGAVILLGPTLPPHVRSFRALARQRFGGTADEPRRYTLHAIGDYVRSGLGRVLYTYREAMADRPEDKADSIECPALVVRGERDTLADEEWAALLAERLPRGRVLTIPGVAHSVQITASDQVAGAIDQFLAGEKAR